MKKFLAFLLIVAIACTAVEDIELENIFTNIWGWIKKAWNWLKDHGVLDAVKNALVTAGKEAAIALCSRWLDRSACEGVVNSF